MDIDYSILNPEQLEAVQTTEGAVRVIASAGSEKTKALTDLRIKRTPATQNQQERDLLKLPECV